MRFIRSAILTEPDFANPSLRPSRLSNSTYPKPLGLSSLSLMILIDLVWDVEKKSSSSASVKSKDKFPINAVYGGAVGMGRSSRGGPDRSANVPTQMSTGEAVDLESTYVWKRGNRLLYGRSFRHLDHRRSSSRLEIIVSALPELTRWNLRALGSESISSAHEPRAE